MPLNGRKHVNRHHFSSFLSELESFTISIQIVGQKMSLTLLLLSVLILILFCTVFKKLYRNVQLYQYVSKQKDFYPNPSWTIGVLRVLLDASYRGYVGFSCKNSLLCILPYDY